MHPPLPLQQGASLLLAVDVSPSPPGRLACGLPASSALSDTQRSSTPCSGTGRSGATLAWRTRRWRTLAWNPIQLFHGAIEASDGGGGGEQQAVGGLREKESANAQGGWQMIDWRDE
jgi:hypothetical protein